jgi:hypothetical protein
MSSGLYLFCLARLSRLPLLPLGGKGLNGQSPIQVLDFEDLAAVFCPVALEDFCGPEAAERLRDLTWIGPRILRHQEVVAGVMRHSPVLPARFGTIFSSPANLRRILQRHHDAIAGFLGQVTNQAEWAVKGMLDRAAAQEKLLSLRLAQEADRLAGLSPGRRYFQEQRLRAGSAQELQEWLQEVGRELWRELHTYAAAVRERRLLAREASGSDKEMLWNWAFLVAEKAVEDFRARIGEANAQYSDRGLVLEFTGPWPPYSFTPALDLKSEL